MLWLDVGHAIEDVHHVVGDPGPVRVKLGETSDLIKVYAKERLPKLCFNLGPKFC